MHILSLPLSSSNFIAIVIITIIATFVIIIDSSTSCWQDKVKLAFTFSACMYVKIRSVKFIGNEWLYLKCISCIKTKETYDTRLFNDNEMSPLTSYGAI